MLYFNTLPRTPCWTDFILQTMGICHGCASAYE